mmetsp:Transcript_101258/g.292828  ORF Transcript_101258/g.292828 Transcript_101258/m.292828 type:complete len:243 (-) Transcript_101258:61-789(-)
MNVTFRNSFLHFSSTGETSVGSGAGVRRVRAQSAPPPIDDGPGGGSTTALAEQLVSLCDIMAIGSADGELLEAAQVADAWKSDLSNAATGASRTPGQTASMKNHEVSSDTLTARSTEEHGPSDLNECMPSLGSLKHALGTCRPCAFARSSQGCKSGTACLFCHFPMEHQQQMRSRPCKGKRDRMKKHITRLEREVATNPSLVNGDSLHIPQFLESTPQAKARLRTRLEFVAETSIGCAPLNA